MSSPSDGDAVDRQNITANNTTIQELAVAGPAAIESFGPEAAGRLFRVEFVRHGLTPITFLLRCGLAAAGGET